MKTHGLHESTCHSHPSPTPSLSPQISSPYPAYQINIKNTDALYRVSRSRRSGSKRSRVRRYISNTQLATSEEHTRTHSPVDSLDLQMINADTHTNKHTQTINADTRTFMLQPYQMPYVKLLRYLHNCISFNCKYYRSFTSNVCLISTYTRKI